MEEVSGRGVERKAKDMTIEIPILAKGEFPHSAGVVQVVDDAALDAVAAQTIPDGGLLLDFDHYSDLTEEERAELKRMGIQLPSEAAGWLKRLFRRGDKVFGETELTDKGAEAVKGRGYRFTSPVFDWAGLENLGGDRVRPRHVEKVGLTNEPNIRAIGAILANRRGFALANSEGDAAWRMIGGEPMSMQDVEAPAIDKGPETAEKQHGENMELEKLAGMLGCEATEEAVTAALEALKAQAAKAAEKSDGEGDKPGVANGEGCGDAADEEKKELQNRVAKLEAELKQTKVDAELAKHPGLKNREAAGAVLSADWDAGVKMLAELDAAQAATVGSAKGANPESGLANRAGTDGDQKNELTGEDRVVAALKNRKTN